MNIKKIVESIDHTLLSQTALLQEIYELCDEAILRGTASVCIPPSYVQTAKEYMNEKMKICTVIGFPNGYSTTKIKSLEAIDAISNGADEIDMVINLGYLKDKRYNLIKDEIISVKAACEDKLLKIIVETCLLTESEKRRMCEIVVNSGADYIKTSTGFAGGGATFADVSLFAEELKNTNVKIKASGRIKTLEDAEKYIELGASRLGTSSLLKLIND